MKSLQSLRRFISASWLVAAPLVVLLLLIVVPILFAVVSAIIERVYGNEAADDFSAYMFGAMMWGAELVLVLAPIALAVYGIVRVARWLARRKEP
jgi:hypothetical protein